MQTLIVDDSSAMRMILRRMLTEMGMEVQEAPNGREALRILNDGFNPDVLLLDWSMPEMDGYELLREIRGKGEMDVVKVLMVTSESQPESVQKALDAGADEYLMKPFTKEILRDKLSLLGLKEF